MADGGFARGSRSKLPGWSRGGLAGRLPTVRGILYRDESLKSRGDKREGLEESLLFLRQQHKETLQQLHSEAERLQRENRELSFRLIMCRCGQRTPSTAGTLPTEKTEPLDEHLLRLREEVQWLQSALAKERQRNERLWELLQAQLQERQETCQEERQREVAPTTKQHTRGNRGALGEIQRGQDPYKLPALKPRLPAGGVAERHRKRQALQRRLSRTILPPLQPPLT